MRRTIALTTPSDRQAPFAEYIEGEVWVDTTYVGIWRIWKNFNKDATAGTYLELHPNGSVQRVTIGPDGNIAETVSILQEM